MSTIDSIDYVVLNTGYVERLILNEPIKSEKVKKTGFYINYHQYDQMKCKENHWGSKWDYADAKIYGGYDCVNDLNDDGYCNCCSYYDEPDEPTWESEDNHPQPSIYYPYMAVAVIDAVGDISNIHFDKRVEVDTLISDFPEVLKSNSIIFKRIDGKPMKLSEYITIAERINCLFCGCYSPTRPIEIKVISSGNKNLLYLHYDTESG